ncbi:MAG: amino acid adenylation domain-containing protein, partial [bacterium]|nr:amino acid adenylation domain-containing protein [bacterium]
MAGEIVGSDNPELTEFIELVRDEVATVLGLDERTPTPVELPLVRLGLDSLTGLELRNQLETRTNTSLPATLAFDYPTIEAIAERLADQPERAKPRDLLPLTANLLDLSDEELAAAGMLEMLKERFGDARSRLSPGQERLWFLDQVLDAPETYHVHMSCRITRDLDASLFQGALEVLGQRHEQLRVRFVRDNGGLTQDVQPEVPLELVRHDLQHLPEAERERAMGQLSSALCRQPFALDQAPLLRVGLVRLEPSVEVLVLVWHHIVTDGASVSILLSELSRAYVALEEGRPVELGPQPAPYRRYAERLRNWLDGDDAEAQRAFWRTQLAGLTPLDLGADYAPPARRSGRGGVEGCAFDRELSQGVHKLARTLDCTPFVVLLGAWSLLQHRGSGQADFAIGTVLSGRDDPEFVNTIGFFVRTLPIRCDCGDDPAISDYLVRLRHVVLEAMRHQKLPYGEIVRCADAPIRPAGQDPLIQVAFILEDGRPIGDVPFAGTDAQFPQSSVSGDVEGTAKFDLCLAMVETPDGYRASLEYSRDLFERSTIVRTLSRLRETLRSMAEAPQAQLSAVSILPQQEIAQLQRWSSPSASPPTPQTIVALFEDQVAASADQPAVVVSDEVLSYRLLNARANQLAHHLIGMGVGRGSTVGVHLPRSPELAVALLGILKAGGAYVPLDPEYPAARLRFMAKDAGLRVLLTASAGPDPGWPEDTPLVHLDEWPAVLEEQPSEAPSPLDGAPGPDDLAYVIYTSGSTGHPKGVMISHGALCSFLWGMRKQVRAGASERMLSVTTMSFDIFGLELFGPLLGGGTVDLVPDDKTGSADWLLDRMRSTRPTVMQATPATWKMLVDRGLPHDIGLRGLCGGEAMDLQLARALSAWSPEATNVYGPTEVTIWATQWAIPPDPTNVRIGEPIGATVCHVLDSKGNACPIGVPGELYLGGPQVARGYLNRPEETAERFLADPFGPPDARMFRTGDLARWCEDGTLEFLGRNDHQVKIRGFRIELGEVECALLEHPGISNGAAIVREDRPGHKRLVAYYSERNENAGPTISVQALRDHVSAHLPAFMVPTGWVHLDALPLTPNGKTDRAALAALPDDRAGLAGEIVGSDNPELTE